MTSMTILSELLARMNIHSNVFINNIQVFYRLRDGGIFGAPGHGRTADPLSTITLADVKKLIRMDGMIGNL